MNNSLEEKLISLAIEEDIGPGDYTSLACFPTESTGKAKLMAKDHGILAGINTVVKIFNKIDPRLEIQLNQKDGEKINPGDEIFIVSGPSISLLKSERLVLNFLQRMSGIATLTKRFVDKVEGLPAKILDTRKTTPGMRYFEKMAVNIGGGVNHRMGLFDRILIKDNHIDMSGGIEKAIDNVHNYLITHSLHLPVEIETRSLEDVEKVLARGEISRIMLDNFSVELTKKAVSLIDHYYETESSGGIVLENIRNYALCGVDFISVGALTHQIQSLDMSLIAY